MRRVAQILVALLVVTSCHSIDRGVFARGPVPLAVLPLREPITYTVGPDAGQPVPRQHGLLASYFSGAAYVQPAYGEVLDHQQIDPNVDFQWNATGGVNPVIAVGGIDVSEGHPFRPPQWPIWSIVWEGYLEAPTTGEYVLNLHVNNGGWLEMKDSTGSLRTVISCPGGSGFEGDCAATIGLTAALHYIRISYYNNAPSTANAIFSWRVPFASGLSVVPSSALWTQKRSLPPLVFIPGLAGSQLRATSAQTVTVPTSSGADREISLDAGELVWVDTLRALFDAEFHEVLMFTSGGASLVPSLEADGLIEQSYGEVVPFLTRAGYREGTTLWTFPYDWRYGVESNVEALDALVEEIRSTTGAPKVDIVAHSLGTLVTRAYLGTPGAHEKVRHAVLLGGPLLGTPRGTFAILEGLCVTQVGPLCVIGPQHTRHVLRSLPSALQVGVSSRYYEIFDGSDREHPLALVDRRLSGGALPPFDYDYAREQQLRSGASAPALNEAESFHVDDLTWLSPTLRPLPQVSLVAGTGKCTIGQIVKQSSIVRSGNSISLRETHGIREIDGDDTVIRQSASLVDEDRGLFANHATPVYYRNLSHGELASRPGLSIVLDLLSGNPVAVGAPSAPLCLSFILGSPMEFLIADQNGDRIGGLDPAHITRDIAGATYDRVDETKFAMLPFTGRYDVQLRGTAVGDSTIRIRWIAGGDSEQEAIFLHVGTTPQTRAAVTFGADRTVTALELDQDGDGTVDEVLAPTIITGSAAQDDTKPAVTIVSPKPSQAVVGQFDLNWSADDPESGLASVSAIVDRGSAAQQLHTSPGSVELAPGTHHLEVFAENRLGLAELATRDTTAYDHGWLVPLGANGTYRERVGRTIPVRFTVSDLDGEFVVDESVTVRLVDEAGNAAVQEIGVGLEPDSAVVVRRGFYQTNLATTGLEPGLYRIEVRFDSPTLTGRLSLPLELR